MSERWAPVPGWEGYYEASAEGRVRSMARDVEGRPGVVMHLRTKILRPTVNSSGHLVVALSRDGRKVERQVHRLVLAAHVGPCPEGMEGCHNNGDPSNNTVSNLRWDTRSANTHDKVRHGVHPWARKTHCPAGHLYDETNTYRHPGSGSRQCRTCRRAANRARYTAKKETAHV